MITHKQIIKTARKYIDVPWEHQGRSYFGVDCLGLLVLVAKELKFNPIDVIDYSMFYNPKLLIKGFLNNGCRKIAISNAVSGDMVLINVGKAPMHVGILSWKDNVRHIIHSYRPAKFVREEEVYPMLKKRFFISFAYPGL